MLPFILKVLWDAKYAFRGLKGDFILVWPSTPLGKLLGREVADLAFCLVRETAVVKEWLDLDPGFLIGPHNLRRRLKKNGSQISLVFSATPIQAPSLPGPAPMR